MKMYTLKPIVSLPEALYHSEYLYEMKNIHSERTMVDHAGHADKPVTDITDQVPVAEFAALEARQERILSQLTVLKKQVSTLFEFLKQNNQSQTKETCQIQKEPVKVDVVVNVNPLRPPYSLKALRKIWKDSNVILITHRHSSAIGKIPLDFTLNTTNDSKTNVISLMVIWKEVNDLEINIGFKKSIKGEVNLLRYLSRLVDNENYDLTNSEDINDIDAVLDLCHLYQAESKKRVQILQQLNEILGKCKSFGSNSYDLRDVTVWSIIKQTSTEKLPSNLKRWFETCEKFFR